MHDGNTPEGTALSPDEGKQKLSALLGTPSEQPETLKRDETPEVKEQTSTREPEEETEEVDTEATASEEHSEEAEDAETTDDTEEVEGEPVKFRLSDGTEVTAEEIEEWRKGNLRQSDYTRKSQKLAERVRAMEEHEAQIAQQRQHFEQVIPFAVQMAQAAIPEPPDPSLMDRNSPDFDPVEYWSQKDAHDRAVQQYQELANGWETHKRTIEQEEQRARAERLRNGQEYLRQQLPELKDPARFAQFRNDLTTGVVAYGYKAEDLSDIEDPRMLIILKDAIAYRKLKSQKPKAIDKAKDAIPVQKPGKRPSPGEAQARARKEQMAKLRKTGDRHIGQSLIKDLLTRSSR